MFRLWCDDCGADGETRSSAMAEELVEMHAEMLPDHSPTFEEVSDDE